MPFFNENIREKIHNIVGNDIHEYSWKPVISIGAAAKLLELSPSAIRKYEKEGLLLYYRTPTGRRLLSKADIDRIRFIHHLITDLGLNIAGIRHLLALLPCWQLKTCKEKNCQQCLTAHDSSRACWMIRQLQCPDESSNCRECVVYRYGAFLADDLKSLVFHCKKYQQRKQNKMKYTEE